VCKTLVLHDPSQRNPFRDLIPLTRHYPLLLQIIIANSALHMFNTSRKHSMRTSQKNTNPRGQETSRPYLDALAAKSRALNMLRSALTDKTPMDSDIILAAMILFVELELLDSGKDNWRHHIEGARSIIADLCKPQMLQNLATSPMRTCLISNWMA
jgi:hypothetical protein